MRDSGILLPIFALPSKYGIGCFSKEAYEFVDQLEEAGQSKWQILPLGPTGYGDSPYQSFSTFAGNPYFIDLETLIKDGLLTADECGFCDFGAVEDRIDYEKLYLNRFAILHKAYRRFQSSVEYSPLSPLQSNERDEYRRFIEQNQDWLEGYALFMALKNKYGGKSWKEWESSLRDREEKALLAAKGELAEEIDFFYFQQYQFTRQWQRLHSYANKRGIEIIGDIPIYVAFDSADTWGAPQLFQFDSDMNPTAVAGCPPDGFSPTGQLWGNPLYDWDYHKKTGYEWWLRRIAHCFRLYDIVRIDHFRGFDEYYAIPYNEPTAVNGKWLPGPGPGFFKTIEKELGRLNIIAEDLGFLTDSVLSLLADTGFPGMKVIQFAFDSRESSNYLPHTYAPNCVVYTGTHDNDTTRGWYHHVDKKCRVFAKEYLHRHSLDEDELSWDFIAMAMGSVAKLCVIPVQDYLCLGSEARINTPSTLGNNWTWRLKKARINASVIDEIRRITKLYGRLPQREDGSKRSAPENATMTL